MLVIIGKEFPYGTQKGVKAGKMHLLVASRTFV
jgi:hypothetical protein